MIFARLYRMAMGFVLLAVAAATAPAGWAQPADRDTIRLGMLFEMAERTDPRYRQLQVNEVITDFVMANLATGRRPQLDLSARASYQSETASIPFEEGAGVPFSIPTPPKDQYEVAAELGQLLYDGGRLAAAEQLERRRLSERLAEIHATLYSLRPEINGAFFAALLHQEQQAQIRVAMEDLEARRHLVAAQARSGAALPSDEAAVESEVLYLKQRLAVAEAARRAALRRLELLTGISVAPGDILAAPDLAQAAGAAIARIEASDERTAGDIIMRRPEFDRFARARERALAQSGAIERETRPRVSAFARLSVGRPGYDFFDESIRPYGMVGLRAQWSPFDWGAASRRAAAAALQADVVATEAAAFEARLDREVLEALYAVKRLEATLLSDEHAATLRERIERAAQRQLEEGVVLAADYLQKRNDVLEARLRQRTHRVELAESRARLLTVLGLEIPAASLDDSIREPVAPPEPFIVDHTLNDR